MTEPVIVHPHRTALGTDGEVHRWEFVDTPVVRELLGPPPSRRTVPQDGTAYRLDLGEDGNYGLDQHTRAQILRVLGEEDR